MTDAIDSPVLAPSTRGVELDDGFTPLFDLRNESLVFALSEVLPTELSGVRDDGLAGAIWLGSASARARNAGCHDDASIASHIAGDLAATLAAEESDRRISVAAATEVMLTMGGVVDVASESVRELVAQLVARVEVRSAMLPDGARFGDTVNDLWHSLVNMRLFGDSRANRRAADKLLLIATDDESPFWAGRDVADKVVAARAALAV